jgi:hypothetical protein
VPGFAIGHDGYAASDILAPLSSSRQDKLGSRKALIDVIASRVATADGTSEYGSDPGFETVARGSSRSHDASRSRQQRALAELGRLARLGSRRTPSKPGSATGQQGASQWRATLRSKRSGNPLTGSGQSRNALGYRRHVPR